MSAAVAKAPTGWRALGLDVRLRIFASYLRAFGNKSILWRPSVQDPAMRTSRKRNSIGQLINVR